MPNARTLIQLGASAVLTGSVASCGVEFLKPLTPDQMSAFPDVIALAKDRYTGARIAGPLFVSGWSVNSTETRDIAAFAIPTNNVGDQADFDAFIRDMKTYCTYKSGAFDDFNKAEAVRWQELKQQSSRVVEASNRLGTAAFECGPEGHGTVSIDWTKFNPNFCRQLYTTATDIPAMQAGMGHPPNFGCTTPAGALFIGNAKRVSGEGALVTIQVRINQGRGGTVISYTDFPQVE